MTTVYINEKTEAGRRILREVAENPKVGRVEEFFIPLDENGLPVGKPWEEVRYELDLKLSEAYGVDFFKISRLMESGKLDEKDLTEELLSSPRFKYEPYPGFKPKPLEKPDPQWLETMAKEYELINIADNELQENSNNFHSRKTLCAY